ncbi:MAG: hypothetical protein R3C10_25970 [Pirellulales bacterium]
MFERRRAFIRAGISSLAGLGSLAFASTRQGRAAVAAAVDADCLDYGMSFICNKARFNSVRFWIESRTTVTDSQSGGSTTFYQCGSCKSENTFAERDLFVPDNYDFLPILGDGEWLIFRRPVRLSDSYRRVQAIDQVWGEPVPMLRHASAVTELKTWQQIRDVTAAGTPIVARTELANEALGLSAVIEYPVKTMNVDLDGERYQVDTGPIALPDLSKRYNAAIDSLSLAFVAFNAPGFADFVIEQPTPLNDDAGAAETYHYSQPISLPAQNRLYAAEPHRAE